MIDCQQQSKRSIDAQLYPSIVYIRLRASGLIVWLGKKVESSTTNISTIGSNETVQPYLNYLV